MKGFKDFIMRGNVIDLAVAVIIGAAFTSIVTAIVDGIFNPIIAALFNTSDIAGAVWTIGGVNVGIGAFIAAVINFILIAAVVYFVIILPMNKVQEAAYVKKHGHKKSDEPAPPSETDLLIEIRDLLAKQEQQR